MMKSNQPIGIFDSGVGGLTVAKAVKEILPQESLVYFGDTAHLPYGDKSTAAIQAYSVRIADFLLSHKCKVILIACNSASSAAFDLVVEFVGRKAKVFDVINPTIDFIRENHEHNKVGLIGTKQTVTSGVYADKIAALKQGIELKAHATPLLVPLIEEGFHADEISLNIIEKYLGNEVLNEIDSLILGCTHYPIIKEQIVQYYRRAKLKVSVIDSAETVVESLKAYLASQQLLSKSNVNEDQFFISDFTPAFESTTKMFFGQKVHLERLPIWDEFH